MVIRTDGVQGGGFKGTLKNFSFAKQRFESEEGPDRKIAITLMASVLFLTSEADDPNRTKVERDNSDEIMTVINPADLSLYGISSDLGSSGVAFLRLVDVHHPDPSLLLRHLKRFIVELRILYVEGRILHESNTGTVTAIILQTLAQNAGKTFFWKDKSRTFAEVAHHDSVLGALRRVQKIVFLLIETLEAEFHDDLFPQWWEIFDLYAWDHAAPGSQDEQRLWAKFNKLCRSRGWNEIVAARQWSKIKEIALSKFRARPERERESDGVSAAPDVSAGAAPAANAGAAPAADAPELHPAADAPGDGAAPGAAPAADPPELHDDNDDSGNTSPHDGAAGRGLNRRCWAEAMVEAEAAHGHLPLGKAMYAWFKGVSDSTCDIERLIGVVKKHIKVKHADIGSWSLRDVLTVSAFGPQRKADLATRSVCPDSRSVHLVPTEFLRRCNAMWVMHFGRRYSVNSMARSDKGRQREKRSGTYASVVTAGKGAKRALLQLSGETMTADTLVPGLTMESLPPKRKQFRTIRQQQIARSARDKLKKLKADPVVGGVDADVSAASMDIDDMSLSAFALAEPKAKAKAKAEAKAKPKAKARAKGKAKAKAKATAKAEAKAKPKAKARATETAVGTKFYAYGFADHERPALLGGRKWIDSAHKADVIIVPDLAVLQSVRDSKDERISRALLCAMLFGKRIGTATLCHELVPGAGTTIKFEPLLARKFALFFTPHFTENHNSTIDMFRRAAADLGPKCAVRELDDVDSAYALGKNAMVVDSLVSYCNFVRRLARVERDRGGVPTPWFR